ncbi:hypothetical protein Cabys_2031 [Caldithrix abyssi DSM 13497]|uniref:Uncharacterized protein n=1 Tax=Caldithrix abyssi DSM 13497 TaxID=880073 RepID=A0A1J1C8Q2_CALAY|nr:hypothetical protein Cabys_2031 [Caldithrix abyssi DSM 13497]
MRLKKLKTKINICKYLKFLILLRMFFQLILNIFSPLNFYHILHF